MAKRKNDQDKRSQEKKERPSKEKEDAKMKALYAKMRKKFSAADLQKYTEIEEGIPAEQVVAEMEKIHREEMKKRRRNGPK